MVVKQFTCATCGAEGKISLKGVDLSFEDIVYCPLCSADIYEPEEDSED